MQYPQRKKSRSKKPVELFSVLGQVVLDGGKKRFAFNSPGMYFTSLNRLAPGKQYRVTFNEDVFSRSHSQLAYHWVLLGLISDHSGHSKEELHDVVMRAKFGTKKIKIAGIEQEVRKSISNSANMKMADAVELITFDLEICAKLDIFVPSMADLGYLPS